MSTNLDQNALLRAMNEYFGLEDIKGLCFDLGIDYEAVGGSTKGGRIRELILYCRRRDMLDQLVAACAEARPNVDWADLTGWQLSEVREESPQETSPQTLGNDSDESLIFRTDPGRPEAKPDFSGKLKIFLCHASQDQQVVRQLNDQLAADGHDPWLDALKLLPGMKWDDQIQIALEECHLVLVCLSQASTSKEGYVQREIGFVLDRAEEMPEGTLFLIPAKLEECQLPRRLREYQAVNLYETGGYQRLREALEYRKRDLVDRA